MGYIDNMKFQMQNTNVKTSKYKYRILKIVDGNTKYIGSWTLANTSIEYSR